MAGEPAEGVAPDAYWRVTYRSEPIPREKQMLVRIVSKAAVTTAVLAATVLAGTPATVAQAAAAAARGPFDRYTGSTPLAKIAPGTVLKTRILSYHIAGIALPVQVVQLLYRSAGA